jgi:hypothetical protein
MKAEEAKTKICPFMSIETLQNCICEPCMFWVNTIKGKEEVSRKKIPYDIYPMEEGRLRGSLEKEGYVPVKLNGEFRDTYIKYEESHEGYCSRHTNN